MEIEYSFNYETLETTIMKVIDANGDVTFDATVEHDGQTFDVTEIGDRAFMGCSMTSITIPEGVVEVGYEAFRDCPRLKTVNIPASVDRIAVPRQYDPHCMSPAFYNTRSLQEINVAEGNLTYAAEEGILYSADKTTLIYCLRSKRGPVSVPAGVMKIGDYAFRDCDSITDVTLPNTVSEIGFSAFENSSLRSITIPRGCTLDDEVFEGCEKLTAVTLPVTSGIRGLTIKPTKDGWTIKPCN